MGAVEAHPELADEPQSVAIEYAKAVKEQPELVGEDVPPRHVVDVARQRREQARSEQAQAARILEIAGDPDGKIAAAALRRDVAVGVSATRSKLLALNPDAFVPALDEGDIQSLRWLVRDAREWFDRVEAAMPAAIRVISGR